MAVCVKDACGQERIKLAREELSIAIGDVPISSYLQVSRSSFSILVKPIWPLNSKFPKLIYRYPC